MKPREKEIVRLTAYDNTGVTVLQESLPVKIYNEEAHPVLDECTFRRERHIVRLSGIVYDSSGQVAEEFEACFDQGGCLVGDAVRFGDGTILGDWERVTTGHRPKNPTPRQTVCTWSDS